MGCMLSRSWILILIFSLTHLIFAANCRYLNTQQATKKQEVKTEDDKEAAMLRAIIGSRPPRCERRCSSCVHCEAIQVPTNPQQQQLIFKKPQNSSSSLNSRTANTLYKIAYSGGDYSSNYKPMSWKCKCGNFIFNP